MKKIYLILFLLISFNIVNSQSKEDYIGTWNETDRLVIGIDAHNPYNNIIIYKNGNYKTKKFDKIITQKFNEQSGLWELTEDNKLKLLFGYNDRFKEFEEQWDIFVLKDNMLIFESTGGVQKEDKLIKEYSSEELKTDIRYKKSK